MEERKQALDELLLGEAQIKVDDAKELLLHERNLGDLEQATAVDCPVLVLRCGVVEKLGRDDESGEEDPMPGAHHT